MSLRKYIETQLEKDHEDAIAWNQAIFFNEPPADDGNYAYTYYSGPCAIYHGFTTDALSRARAHWDHAPWASWVDGVRYRKCSTAKSARKLERRLQRNIPSLCHHGGMTFTYHDSPDPSWDKIDRESKINHVKGYCRLPGGICDINARLQWATDLATGKISLSDFSEPVTCPLR